MWFSGVEKVGGEKNRDWIATHKEQSSGAAEQRDEVKRDLCVCVCVF